MKFIEMIMKVGDRVKFVSDTGVGRVMKINGSIVDVDIQDGFIMPCAISDLVVVQEEDEIAAIKSIGMGDERPGVKKKAAVVAAKKKETAGKKEPAYAKYGKISLINDADGDDDDEYLDMDRIKDIYLRNKAAEEQREHEFEEARLRQERAREMVTESSAIVEQEPQEEKLKATTLEELAQKMEMDSPKPAPMVKEKKASDIEVVDLHAPQILESTAGLSNGEILTAQLSRFRIALDLAVKSGTHGKIVFIHGVGSGKLKMEMQKILKSNYSKLASQDASFREYGYGAIMIFY